VKRPNDLAVSMHFRLYEFEDPTTLTVRLAPELPPALERVRALYGAPLRVTSGYRTSEHNARVGGVRNSEHLRGRAADLVGVVGTIRQLYAAASQIPELLAVNEGDHVHVELRHAL